MKRTQRKDALRNIIRQFISFLSILIVVALGVGIFLACRNGALAMEQKGNTFYRETNYRDVEIRSTHGITQEDIAAVTACDGVSDAEGIMTVDLVGEGDGKKTIVHVISQTARMDQAQLLDGAMPAVANECVVEDQLLSLLNLSVGDTLILSAKDGGQSDLLTGESFRITGTIRHPDHFHYGEVEDYDVLLLPDAFDRSSVDGGWTGLLVKADTADLNTYSTEYEERMNTIIQTLEEKGKERAKIRDDIIRQDAQDQIDQEKAKIDDGQAELDDAREALKTGEQDLEDAKKKVSASEKDIADGKEELNASAQKLKISKSQLDESKAELDSSSKELASGREQLDKSKAELDSAKEELQAKKAELDSASKKLENGREQLDAKKAELDSAKEQLDAKKAELDSAKEELESSRELLNEYEALLAFYREELQAKKEEMDSSSEESEISWEELNEYETLLDSAEEELQANKAELDEHQQEYNKSVEKYEDAASAYEQSEDRYLSLRQTFEEKEALYEESNSKYQAELAALQNSQNSYEQKELEYDNGMQEYQNGMDSYNESQEAYDSANADYKRAKNEIAAGEQELSKKKQEISAAEEDLKESAQTVKEKEKDLTAAKEELEEGQKELDAMEDGHWILLDRSLNMSWHELKETIKTFRSIANSFALLFVLLGILVCYSTIGKIIDEQKVLVGTTKALGFYRSEIFGKYLTFGVGSALLGCVAGLFLSYFALEKLILDSVGQSYQIGVFPKCFTLLLAVLSVVCGIVVAILATWAATGKLLHQPATRLMAGYVPTGVKGRRKKKENTASRSLYSGLILRNILTDWKRVLITIVSIAGCTVLLIIGFSMKMSFDGVISRQFTQIIRYDAIVKYLPEQSETVESQIEKILKDEGADLMEAYQLNTFIRVGDSRETVQIISADPDDVTQFYQLKDAVSKKPLSLPESGAVIFNRLAETYNLQIGDQLILVDEKGEEHEIAIAGIYNNYAGRTIFLADGYADQIIGRDVPNNMIAVNQNGADREDITKQLQQVNGFLSLEGSDLERDKYEKIADALNTVIIVMIFMAGVMAAVVLLNLVRIQISQKKRELTIMRVNGFTTMETVGYVLRENVLTTFLGIGLGLVVGNLAAQFNLRSIERVELMMLREVNWKACLLSVLITLIFAAVVNYLALRKIRRLNLRDVND